MTSLTVFSHARPAQTGAALRRAAERHLGHVVFAGMAGKLTKLAAGVLMTHYTRSKVDLALLADITRAAGGPEDLAEQIGNANTARHAADLGLLPVVVEDACGVVDADAAQRSLASLDYSLLSYRAPAAEVVAAFRGPAAG